MLRIFRHYIPTTLLLLGLAEALILVVSIYVGAALAIAIGELAPAAGTLDIGMSVLSRAAVFSAAMLAGMVAMGFYQRDQRDGPLATIVRLLQSFVVGFLVLMWLGLQSGSVVQTWTARALTAFYFGFFISFFFLYPSTFNILEVAAVDKPKLHLWETGGWGGWGWGCSRGWCWWGV